MLSNLAAKLLDVVLHDLELTPGGPLTGGEPVHLRLEFGEAPVQRLDVLLRRLRGRLLDDQDLVAQRLDLVVSGGILLQRERQGKTGRSRGKRQHRDRGAHVGPHPKLALDLSDPGTKAVDALLGIGGAWGAGDAGDAGFPAVASRPLTSFAATPRPSAWTARNGRRGRRTGTTVPGRGSATSPSAGSSGRPCSTQASSPPARL